MDRHGEERTKGDACSVLSSDVPAGSVLNSGCGRVSRQECGRKYHVGCSHVHVKTAWEIPPSGRWVWQSNKDGIMLDHAHRVRVKKLSLGQRTYLSSKLLSCFKPPISTPNPPRNSAAASISA